MNVNQPGAHLSCNCWGNTDLEKTCMKSTLCVGLKLDETSVFCQAGSGTVCVCVCSVCLCQVGYFVGNGSERVCHVYLC